MGEIRCTTLANKMQNTKLILCLLGAALVAGAFAATCQKCTSGATTCTSKTCSGSQKCLATTYVSTTNVTTTDCDVAGYCSTYSIANNGCKSITLVWKSSYYCSTSTPAWAVTAAKNRQAFPSTVSCPATSAFAIIISIFVVCCCPLIIFCICCGGIACCIGGAASQSA